jgi:anthranilate phosphoribosyltransferase
LADGLALTEAEARKNHVGNHEWAGPPAQIAAYIMALRNRGETAEAIAAAPPPARLFIRRRCAERHCCGYLRHRRS